MASQLSADRRSIALFRCDASARVGFGHATRCLALADAFREGNEWDVAFAVADGPEGAALIRARGYPVDLNAAAVDDPERESEWLRDLVRTNVAVVILDIRTGLSRASVRAIRANGRMVVVLDDGSDRRIEADLAFYPPVPQVAALGWTGFAGERFVGWQWIPLRKEVAEARLSTAPRDMRSGTTPVVVVSMGGSDPGGLTLLAISALELVPLDVRAKLVVGPAFLHRRDLQQRLERARRHYEILDDQTLLIQEAAKADLAIASFGVTAYELAGIGVPAVHLCLTDEHAISASALEAVGAAVNLGVYSRVTPEALAQRVTDLLRDSETRARMSERATATVDGLGAQRIAAIVREHAGGPRAVRH